MQRRVVLWGLGALGVALGQPAQARAGAAGGIRVEAVQFPCWHGGGSDRDALEPGETVSTAEQVETGEGAALVMEMPDGGVIRLGEKTRLEVRQYKATVELGQAQVQSELRLADGFFRYATAAASQVVARRDIKLVVRTATIGIRGTDFWAMTDAVHDAACLFEGRVDLDTRDQGQLVLEKPTAFWARFFDQPVKPVGNATPDELGKFLKSTELKPGSGVAVAGGRWRVVAATLPSQARAQALARRLREAGYPAVLAARKGGHEVRINRLVSRDDAAAVLRRIAGIDGVNGRVALSA
jgi:hypothetical protein